MAEDLSLADRVTDALTAEGIKYSWVRNVDGTAANFEIYFEEGVSEADKARAYVIAAAEINKP